MTVTHLLDVNLLLALCDPRHVHHEAAHRWFKSVGGRSWATCPFTENGFVRIASQPRYPNRPGGVAVVTALLKCFCNQPKHVFWPDTITIREDRVFNANHVLTSGQLTDVYLLALAVRQNGRLATLDGGIPADAVSGGRPALTVIAA